MDPPWPNKKALKYLRAPDGMPDFGAHTSPPVTPFRDPLFIPPVKRPDPAPPVPSPDPERHQLYATYPPRHFYTVRESEFLWKFHSDYGRRTWSWGFDGTSPGPTYQARYGAPVLVRRYNELPPVGYANVGFALPSTTTHLHNGHTASESDGEPNDWIGEGEYWDHHYGNFPATVVDPTTGQRWEDEREKLTTLWYHDHRMDFTAPNVYAGLFGMYQLFDEHDTGDENDTDPDAWRLPSGEFDVPLMLQDLAFDDDHQLVFDGFHTHGILGDRFTVNRTVQPHFRVQRRKYRFRFLNACPSRFVQLFLNRAADAHGGDADDFVRFVVISGDGNIQPEPVETTSVYMGPAQRVDVIVDFSRFQAGEQLFLENRLEQSQPHGPSGRHLKDAREIREHRWLRFDVVGGEVTDPSRIPDYFRSLPPADEAAAVRRRSWQFDYDGGLWTINGRPMEPDRIDAGIEADSAEIWTFRNNGLTWHHPVHSHMSEWLVLDVNGIPMLDDMVQISPHVTSGADFQRVFTKSGSDGGDYEIGRNVLRGPWCGGRRRDIANLGPRTEVTMFSRWPDFLGRYILHCHNIVHEDHAMMTRWDVVPRGQGFVGPRYAHEVYGTDMQPMHNEPHPAQSVMGHGMTAFRPGSQGRPGMPGGGGGDGSGHHGR
jgi:FtsP/CotA-like multicopper oxidase with cupredoxin domain